MPHVENRQYVAQREKAGFAVLSADSLHLPDTAAGKTSKRTSKNIGKSKLPGGKSQERNYHAKYPVLSSSYATETQVENVGLNKPKRIYVHLSSVTLINGVYPTPSRMMSARSAREARFYTGILSYGKYAIDEVGDIQARGLTMREAYALSLNVTLPVGHTWYRKPDGEKVYRCSREEELEKRIAQAEYLLSTEHRTEVSACNARIVRSEQNKKNRNAKKWKAQLQHRDDRRFASL